MRQKLHTRAVLGASLLLLLTTLSCSDLLSGRTGTLVVGIDASSLTPPTRTSSSIPPVDEFILTITSSSGKTIYEGLYGESPESFTVSAGSYTVSAVSCHFGEPAFDCPQFGDTQAVVVGSGGLVSVSLVCRQLNAGLTLLADDTFRSTFPSGSLLVSGTDGTLSYSYDETRTAFFRPGTLSVTLVTSDSSLPLFSRTLEAAQMMTMRVSSSVSATSGGVSVQVDTVRTYLSDSYCYGAEGGNDADSAYSVSEARDHIGESDRWVWGYMVGVASNTSKFSFTPPFEKNTNIVLGLRENSTDKEWLLSVELPSGAIRTALNLADNPSLLGSKVALRGNIVAAYYGIPGLKAPTEYQFR